MSKERESQSKRANEQQPHGGGINKPEPHPPQRIDADQDKSQRDTDNRNPTVWERLGEPRTYELSDAGYAMIGGRPKQIQLRFDDFIQLGVKFRHRRGLSCSSRHRDEFLYYLVLQHLGEQASRLADEAGQDLFTWGRLWNAELRRIPL